MGTSAKIQRLAGAVVETDFGGNVERTRVRHAEVAIDFAQFDDGRALHVLDRLGGVHDIGRPSRRTPVSFGRPMVILEPSTVSSPMDRSPILPRNGSNTALAINAASPTTTPAGTARRRKTHQPRMIPRRGEGPQADLVTPDGRRRAGRKPAALGRPVRSRCWRRHVVPRCSRRRRAAPPNILSAAKK